MDLGNVYSGLVVKSKKIDNIIFEVLRIDDYDQRASCMALNSYDRKVVEINIEDLEEV